MKKPFLWFVLVFATAVAAQSQTAPAIKQANPHPSVKPNPNGVTIADLKELGAARKAALQADPELAKEQTALQQKIRDFQHKVDQVILQSNPELGSMIAKLESSPVPHLPMPPPGMLSASSSATTSTQANHP